MKVYTIRIPDVESAKQFCRMAGKCHFDVDLFYNRVIIDAKSILGVLSMDLRKDLNVRMYGDNAEFEELCIKLSNEASESVA